MYVEELTFDPRTGMVLNPCSGQYETSFKTEDGTVYYKLVWTGGSWYNPNTGLDEKCEPEGSGLAPEHSNNSWRGHYTCHLHD